MAAHLPKSEPASRPDWVSALLRDGYVVVPDVLDAATVVSVKQTLREDVLAFTSGRVDLDDPTTFSRWADYCLLHNMLIQHHGVGHMASAWAIRQHPRVAAVFSTLWGCAADDLLVSFDALSIHLPPEKTRTPSTGKPRGWFRPGSEWFHTDQGPLTPGDCIQVRCRL